MRPVVDRSKLLDAALRVYAEYGFRGATTRRIADEAGINEITIFRQFGSKEALITAAIQAHGTDGVGPLFPDVPVDPEQELVAWCDAGLTSIRQNRAMLRRALAEMLELPDSAAHVMDGARDARRELDAYVGRLTSHGFVPAVDDAERGAAISMLLAAIRNDGMTRELAPEIFPQPAERAAGLYVRLFLRVLGVRS